MAARNAKYAAVEADARRPLKTSSMTLTASRGAPPQFELSPAHVHFGRVRAGASTSRTAELLNTSGDLGRFTVTQPAAPFSVVYSPGMVPAGLAARLKARAADTARHVVGANCLHRWDPNP